MPVRARRPGLIPGTRESTFLVLAGVFVVLAAAAGGLGLWGLLDVRGRFDPPLGFLAVVRGIIGLYSNDTPDWARPDVAMPLTYEIAKVLGPLSTGYALASTAAVLLGTQLSLLRARLARGHSIVGAGGSAGVALTRALAQDGLAVLVDVDAGSATTSASLVRRVIALSGDPRDRLVLRRAGVHRAREVFALADGDDVNASIVVAALGSAAGRGEPLACYALVDDLMLHLTLQAHMLTNRSEAAVGLHLLDRHQLYATAVVAHEVVAGTRVTAVVGSGETARAMALELVRRLADDAPQAGPARLHLVGADASATAEAIGVRWGPDVHGVEVLPHPASATPEEVHRAPGREPLTHLFVSEADGDRATLRSGLSWLHQLPDLSRVVLCMDGESGLTSTFSQHADEVFAGSAGVLSVYSPAVALSDPVHIRNQSFTERMARRLHEVYRAEVAPAGATEPGSAAALAPWSELPEVLKDSNRDQAAELGRKVAALGMTIVPVGLRPARLQLTAAQVDRLAEMEHERWMANRLGQGLRLGPRRTATEHPDLVPWTNLGERAREKDRVFVRRIPELLLAEGLEVTPNPLMATPTEP